MILIGEFVVLEMKGIYVEGRQGQLGRQLCETLKEKGFQVVSVANFADVVINCAAKTNMEWCDENSQDAFVSNYSLVKKLAETCDDFNIPFIQISSDYCSNPTNIYAYSKLAGESAALQNCARSVVFRTSWLYGKYGPNSFVNKVLTKLEAGETKLCGTEHTGNPTSVTFLVNQILNFLTLTELQRCEFYGKIWDVCSHGYVTRAELIEAIIELTGYGATCELIDIEEPVKRPYHCDTQPKLFFDKMSKYKEFGAYHWKHQLKQYLNEIGKLK